jgi:HTH-type transcriptional regulator/antitoxin HigA
MTQAELAERTNLSTKHVNQIVQGVASITPETALALERVTGAPAAFWTILESGYQLARVRQAEEAGAERERDWVGAFPLPELEKRGIVSDRRDYHRVRNELLAFFGVASREVWERRWMSPHASFRRSKAYRVDNYATACWLRLGEIAAADTPTRPFDATRFRGALAEIRKALTAEPAVFEPLMKQACADAGVALALVPEVKGSRAHGAVRWLAPGKAVLQLSLRLHREDVFWFSFFHECGHVLLHSRRDPFVEYGPGSGDEEEREADAFAMRTLIPEDAAGRLPAVRTDAQIEAFAQELQVPPAVVVGRLQHEKLIPPYRANKFRRSLDFVES